MTDLGNVEPAVADRLRDIDEETWGDVCLELLDFARYKAGRLSFIKGGGELPLGRTPEDLVQEAILRVFDGRRKWDPEVDSDLCAYLKSVISSIVSTLLEKADYSHQAGTPLEEHHDLRSDENVTYNDCLEALQDILQEVSSDEEDLDNVRIGIEDNMKASEIGEFFGIDVHKVYTLSRKLRRRVCEKMIQHPCNDHWTQLGF